MALHNLSFTLPSTDEPCPRPGLKPLQALLQLWENAVHAGGRLPSRRRFSFEAMRPWLGHLAVWTVERAPLRFRAALIGLKLVEWDGQDGTGRYLDEIISQKYRDLAVERYAHVATAGTWHADTARLIAPRTTVAMLHRLLLPCAADGVAVDTIMTAIYRAE